MKQKNGISRHSGDREVPFFNSKGAIPGMNDKEKSIIRKMKGKENPYTMVSNSVIRDQRLSWKSRGLLIYLLSLPDDWTIHVQELVKHGPDGRDSVSSGLKELKAFGYVQVVGIRDERGRIERWEYRVYEEPIEIENPDPTPPTPETENPFVVDLQGKMPQTDFPLVKNPHLLNTDLTKDLSKANTKQQQEPTKNAVVVLQDEVSLTLGITFPKHELERWMNSHGETYIREKIQIIKEQAPVSPLRALRAAIKDNWVINDLSHKKTHQNQNVGLVMQKRAFPSVQPGKYEAFYQLYEKAKVQRDGQRRSS